jgi:DNA-binding transcriptional ArsR family regulator
MDHLSAVWRSPDAEDAASEEADAFKALADPSRRLLLDSLFDADGQTLGELAAQLPGMTRFGVMKHLRILETAGLVTSRKVGRERLHYLNPVPIRLIHDRWIGKYAEAWAAGLANLKERLEAEASARPRSVFETYIRATPEEVWQAITNPEVKSRYMTDVEAAQASRATWDINRRGTVCKLIVTDDGHAHALKGLEWPLVLSSLKSLLETGEGLTIEEP